MLDVGAADGLASEEDTSLALAAVHVLDSLDRGPHVGVEGLGVAGAGDVVGAATDEDIRGTLDREETGNRQGQ